ncbi:MAG: DUF4423 domain-containing protein [Pseudobacteriovorax sp.]|nr:DUF4423 domain-containing protein [Pseudobacteriovorax sp.]
MLAFEEGPHSKDFEFYSPIRYNPSIINETGLASVETQEFNDISILLKAQTGSSSLRELYEARKAKKDSFSLSFISRQCGASKGYLSDVFRGKRQLHPQYWEPIVDVFKLQGRSKSILQKLLELDRNRDDSKTELLLEELARLRKAAATYIKTFPEQSKGMFFALEVYCSFGMFGNSPTLKELRDHFGSGRGIDLDHALRYLISTGAIAYDGIHYRILENHISFVSSESGDYSYNSYLSQSLDFAKQNLEEWSEKRDRSIYEATFISVEKDKLPDFIETIRNQNHQFQADLESKDADTIVLYNMQVFPVSQKRMAKQTD